MALSLEKKEGEKNTETHTEKESVLLAYGRENHAKARV